MTSAALLKDWFFKARVCYFMHAARSEKLLSPRGMLYCGSSPYRDTHHLLMHLMYA